MSVSPILASEAHTADVIERLWAVAQQIRSGEALAPCLPDIDEAADVEKPVARAVLSHLASVARAASGDFTAGESLAEEAVEGWTAVIERTVAQAPAMTPQSHAFHMRLASRHGDFFRKIERNALTQWAEAARLKTRFLRAMIRHDRGDREDALPQALELADEWRRTLPPRLPGLSVIENRAAEWASRLGRADVVQRMSDRAAEMAGRNAPWPPDDPRVWSGPRTAEGLLRFGMAATIIEWPRPATDSQLHERAR